MMGEGEDGSTYGFVRTPPQAPRQFARWLGLSIKSGDGYCQRPEPTPLPFGILIRGRSQAL